MASKEHRFNSYKINKKYFSLITDNIQATLSNSVKHFNSYIKKNTYFSLIVVGFSQAVGFIAKIFIKIKIQASVLLLTPIASVINNQKIILKSIINYFMYIRKNINLKIAINSYIQQTKKISSTINLRLLLSRTLHSLVFPQKQLKILVLIYASPLVGIFYRLWEHDAGGQTIGSFDTWTLSEMFYRQE